MNMHRIVLAAPFLIACSASPAEPDPAASEVGASMRAKPTSVAMAEPVAPGFNHSLSRSRFRVGSASHSTVEHKMEKVVGAEGVFMRNPHTGWVFAVPNAGAPSELAPPLTQSAEEHGKRVLAYFESSGLPGDQVGYVTVGASGHTPVDSGETNKPPPVFEGYTSHLNRVIQGILIPDSIAWARFNVNDEVVMESVYWPDIPSQAITQAVVFRELLAGSAGVDYRQKLPLHENGTVVLRHSSKDEKTGSFTTFVLYRALLGKAGDRRRTTTYYDVNGAELKPPVSQVVPWTK